MLLDPKFTITNGITQALSAIERARGFLAAATLSKDWLKEMQSKAFILEAYSTTHIEGAQLTLEESELLLSGKKIRDADPDDVQELLNYRRAFELVASYLDDGSAITEGLVREIHKALVQDVRGNSAAPGEYRKLQNYIVNSKTKEVIYTPPPAFEVSTMMQELLNWINKEQNISPILVAGIAQFQLVHIHPFLDGNGRTARLLATLCLYRHGYDFKQLFSISEYYDRNRKDYYEAIQSVRNQKMDMTHWLEYFSDGLATQLKELIEQGSRAIKKDVLKNKHHLSSRQMIAINDILKNGALNIQEYAALLPHVPRRSLQRDLKILVDKEVLLPKGATHKIAYYLK
ncbi:MAG: Fic family protein [Chthoniobacterales bacterium]|nr:Fic family protein [Chthoniobacterales bacterium]